MRRHVVASCLFAAALLALTPPAVAFADDATQPPSPTPTPSPSPATPTTSPTAGVASARPASPRPTGGSTPSAAPTDSTASATPSPGPSTTPAPTPSPSPTPDAKTIERHAALLASAQSLAQVIDAQARIARDELTALDAQLRETEASLDGVNSDLEQLRVRSIERRGIVDRSERDALRLLALPSAAIPRDMSDLQRDALDELRAILASFQAQHAALNERVETLARLQEAVRAKRADLERMNARAQLLARAAASSDAEKRAAEVAVLTQIANDAASAQRALAQLIASSLGREVTDAMSSWRLPVRGPITQPFGPSALTLEPPAVYGGTAYAHFHAAIDIAARLYTPVVAASDGIVTFVGHLPDGAEVVLIAHAGGYVSLYAHLDDTFAPPPRKVGERVNSGDVIGYVGLTGITTGPHLHFGVTQAGQPTDPLSLIRS